MDLLDDFLAQVHRKCIDVLLELLLGRGPDDGAGHKPPALAPSQSQLSGRHAIVLCKLGVLLDGSESKRGPEPGHVPGEEGEPGALDVPLVVLAAEGPSRQGRVRQQAHVAVPLGANLRREARGKKEEKCTVVRVSEGVSQGETKSRRGEWDSPRTSSSRTALW